jgi:hypothetical protein
MSVHCNDCGAAPTEEVSLADQRFIRSFTRLIAQVSRGGAFAYHTRVMGPGCRSVCRDRNDARDWRSGPSLR